MKQSQVPWKILLAGALTTQVACAEGAESIQILRNQVPGEGCTIPAGTSEEFLPRGRIDVMAGSGYLFTPLVENRAQAVEASDRLVFIEGADIDIVFSNSDFPPADVVAALDAANLLHFSQLFSGSIEAGGQSTFAFDVVPKQVLEGLAGTVTPDAPVQLIASVAITGTLDGTDTTSNTFKYPVEVCSGCLTNVLGACDALPGDTEIRQGGVCNALQDGIIDCCSNADGSLTCPAVPIVPDPA